MSLSTIHDNGGPPSGPVEDHVSVAIIGTGFSGLGMAIRLLAEGETDFLVFERADAVGGTWRDNTYPGAACDVMAHLYSYSFHPNPNWTSTFGKQRELFDYLRSCSTTYGVDPHIRFRHELRSATWSVLEQRWYLETSQGTYTAKVLISGMGYLSDPNIPDLPGLESFEGPWFHSSRWDHDVELYGKRVAVIGSGASAVQFVPEIQPRVGQLDLYQRSAPWVGPKPDKPNRPHHSWMLRHLPGYQSFRRNFNKWGREVLAFFMGRPGLTFGIRNMAAGHLKKQVKDPELRERLTPDYVIGCKRILFSDTWYPAITRPSVDIVADAVVEIRPDAIVTEDGTVRPTDVIILGTGFRPTNLPVANLVRGREGTRLGDAWQGGYHSYLGVSVPGFPNYFMILGPSSALAHSSMTLMIEAQISYIADGILKMKRQGIGSLAVSEEVTRRYVDKVAGYADGSVWTAGGCTSWYLDAEGRATTLWPTYTWRYRQMSCRFDLDDYEVEPDCTTVEAVLQPV